MIRSDSAEHVVGCAYVCDAPRIALTPHSTPSLTRPKRLLLVTFLPLEHARRVSRARGPSRRGEKLTSRAAATSGVGRRRAVGRGGGAWKVEFEARPIQVQPQPEQKFETDEIRRFEEFLGCFDQTFHLLIVFLSKTETGKPVVKPVPPR